MIAPVTEPSGLPQLRLRRATIDEALALVQDPGCVEDRGTSVYPDEATRFFALRMLERNPEEEDEFVMYHVVEGASARIVGHVGFHGGPDDGGYVRLGYAIVLAARGMGYATQAVDRMLAWAAGQPDVSVVGADTDEANRASQRVLEKNGFVLTRAEGSTRFYQRPARSSRAAASS